MSHQTISFVKSFVRIVGYGMLPYFSFGLLIFPAVVLIGSEVIGVLEEIGCE